MVLIVLGALVVGVLVGVSIYAIVSERRDASFAALDSAQVRERQEHLARSLSLARERGEITNDDVQKFLGVSDSTASRYLNELESRGHLVQIGTTGKSVKYKVK